MEISLDRHSNWPMLTAWLSTLISTYESGAIQTEVGTDDDGFTTYDVPSESAISTRTYAIAHTVEDAAEESRSFAKTSRKGRSRYERQGTEWSSDTETESGSVSASTEGEITLSEEGEEGTRELNVETDNRLTLEPGEAIGEENLRAIRESKLGEWFQDCFECRDRIEMALNANLTWPNILTGLDSYLNNLLGILDLAEISFDSSETLNRMCSLIGLGTWCISDLIALQNILGFLLTEYAYRDPGSGFDWGNIATALFTPLFRMIYGLISTDIDLSAGPVACMRKMLIQVRELIESTRKLDRTMGLTLGELQRSFANVAEDIDNTLIPGELLDEQARKKLRGKVDWFQGDTLLDYGDLIGFLNPVEQVLLSIQDFDTRLTNMVNGFASRFEAMSSESENALRSLMGFTNILMIISRLYVFVDALIKFLKDGREVCREEVDDNGHMQYIPAEPLEAMLQDTNSLPPWLQIEDRPEVIDRLDTSEDAPSDIRIIDTSLRTTSSFPGCVGRVSEDEREKVQRWIEELDQLEV